MIRSLIALGMEAGFEWAQAAEAVVVYMDLSSRQAWLRSCSSHRLVGSLSSTATYETQFQQNLDTILEAAFRALANAQD